ncbi:MAG: PQQ-binding-like beta-propeller repeat protein [Gammaproteobacteria bacterium]|nr:PQQ-binding-like beta-propeller repeat protein [Gammaproteobacteria bacterium]
MFDLDAQHPKGVLHQDWTANIDDYAIDGGWAHQGKVLVVADAVGGVYAFDDESGQIIWKHHEVHDGGVLTLAIHPSGSNFVTAGQDGRVIIWDVAEGQIRQSIDVSKGWVENAVWSPDGKLLAVSCARQVYMYTQEGSEVWRSNDHPSTISAIAWSPIGDLATACYGRVSFFNANTGILCQKLEWKGSLVSMILSPDGDVVACGSQDNSVHFWRRSTEQDSMMSGYPAKPSSLAFDNTGSLLATGGSEVITVWSFLDDGPEGTRPSMLDFHVRPVTKLAFAHHGMNLASAGRDGVVVVWSLDNDGKGDSIGAAILADTGTELSWRPDDSKQAALDAQGGVTVWRIV